MLRKLILFESSFTMMWFSDDSRENWGTREYKRERRIFFWQLVRRISSFLRGISSRNAKVLHETFSSGLFTIQKLHFFCFSSPRTPVLHPSGWHGQNWARRVLKYIDCIVAKRTAPEGERVSFILVGRKLTKIVRFTDIIATFIKFQ